MRRALIGNDIPAEREATVETLDVGTVHLLFSTRRGIWKADWGDGTENNGGWAGSSRDFTAVAVGSPTSHTYSPVSEQTINLWFKNGVKDVFSIALWSATTFLNKLKITDFGTFINQFPNLYSIYIHQYKTPAGTAEDEKMLLNGFLNEVPDSVERIRVDSIIIKETIDKLRINFSKFSATSRLKWLRRYEGGYGGLIVYGDLAKLPTDINYFYLGLGIHNRGITYTAGRVWAEEFDSFFLHCDLLLESSDYTDNILIDLDNSVQTATGDKLIAISSVRTSASDSAVLSLQSKGFSVDTSEFKDGNALTSADFTQGYRNVLTVGGSPFKIIVANANTICPIGGLTDYFTWIIDTAVSGSIISCNAGWRVYIGTVGADFKVVTASVVVNGGTPYTITTPYVVIRYIEKNPASAITPADFSSVGLNFS